MERICSLNREKLSLRNICECVPLFGEQEDFGMSFISSGDNEFLDEYLYELTECERED